jgi:hypothetical protein
MTEPNAATTDALVEAIIRDTRAGSGESLDNLSRRLSATGPDERLIGDLASKNPALLGTGEVS